MVVDTSALAAILLAEPGYERLRDAMTQATDVLVPAPVRVEAGIVMASRTGSSGLADLDDLLVQTGVRVLPFTEAHARAAVEAFLRFGKGRHAAGLNFGDCMTYVVAQAWLFTTDDFTRKDLRVTESGG
jgi:ribonuclease VapC